MWFTARSMKPPLRTIEWIPDRPGVVLPGRVRLIDQTKLPGKLVYLETDDLHKIWTAIKTLQIRGAPAIGIAAAMGVVAAVQKSRARNGAELVAEVERAAGYLATSSPRALQWKITGSPLPPEKLAELCQNIDAVRKVLAGQKVPPPALK